MANDAKLGLLAGVAGVLLVAVVYFPKAPAGLAAGPASQPVAGTAAAPPGVTPAAVVVPTGNGAGARP